MVDNMRLVEKTNADIREIVFDYFNIISKEYEISFEKCKIDDFYQKSLQEIKA
jgi:hypothetical protein